MASKIVCSQLYRQKWLHMNTKRTLSVLVEFCYNVHKVAIPKGKKHDSIMKYKININELKEIAHRPLN